MINYFLIHYEIVGGDGQKSVQTDSEVPRPVLTVEKILYTSCLRCCAVCKKYSGFHALVIHHNLELEFKKSAFLLLGYVKKS